MPGGEDRLGKAFSDRRGATGLVPFLTAGYPSPETSLEMMCELDALGALALEIGIPFSDPIADGPEIQRASEAALARGIGPDETLELVAGFRARSSLPVVLMTYANPILRDGIGRFAGRARAAGVDGIIVSDLPPDEAPETWAALDAEKIATILLVAPTSPAERIPMLIDRCRGFVYCLARTGVTGRGQGYAGSLEERIAGLRGLTKLPVAVGFGIANAEGARPLRGVADAVIVGAAFMRAVGEDPHYGAVERVAGLAREIKGALD